MLSKHSSVFQRWSIDLQMMRLKNFIWTVKLFVFFLDDWLLALVSLDWLLWFNLHWKKTSIMIWNFWLFLWWRVWRGTILRFDQSNLEICYLSWRSTSHWTWIFDRTENIWTDFWSSSFFNTQILFLLNDEKRDSISFEMLVKQIGFLDQKFKMFICLGFV